MPNDHDLEKRKRDVIRALEQYGKTFVSKTVVTDDISNDYTPWGFPDDIGEHVGETLATLVENGKVEQAKCQEMDEEPFIGYRLKQ